MQTLAELTIALAERPALAELAAALARRPARLRVAPLLAAGRAPLAAALARRHGAPILFVVGSGDAALRAADDLRQWLPPEAVLVFPASDAMPYEHMSPGPQVLSRRLRVLAALAERSGDQGPPADDRQAAEPARPSSLIPHPSPLIVVAAVKALLQPTLAPAELERASVALRRGQQVRQDDLVRRLVELGYRAAPTVEEPGELARRGDLVDVWPTAAELPLRVELFGDEVDSMRQFDPATQRSEGRVEAAAIGPPHEIPLWNRELALARIKALQLDGLRREARAEWDEAIGRLEAGERFEGRAFYGPFFRELRGTLLDHLPPGSAVLLSEAQFLAQHAAELHEQAEAQRARLVESAELPPDFPRPYLLWEELLRADGRSTLVDLSNNEGEGQIAPPAFAPAELFGGQFRRLIGDIVERLGRGERVVAVTGQAARLQELVEEGLRADARGAGAEQFSVFHGALDGGWRLPELGVTLYSDAEIFGIRQRRPLSERRKKGRSADERAAFVRGLKPGDYVVHIEHGIALFEGMIHRTVGEIEREYLVLRYAQGDKIYVPVDQVDRVTRYIGTGDGSPTLTRLGTQEWERAKRKARAAVQDLAEDLLNLYAQRQLKQGHAFTPDNEWQRELEAAFPYIETDDQLRAIGDVKADMEQTVPMDRLICGDVGFGKTEVALRAAFKAVQDGRQVAVLVPTTVLAQQHFDTFTRRMAAFPVSVEMLSRFRSPKEQDAITADLGKGRVDIVIGTHRLLSKDVRFKDLGLVIVDEEQRFGVRHKERLKQLRAEVDVLTLTATPIPRTLHMAMAGIRDLSVIDTPPEDRVPIKTYVLPYDENLIREAILREIEREGQVYFVHNRVHSIYHVANRLKSLIPEATIGVGHGQLEERELERVMLDFFEGRFDVLVCTTIIESGLDVPNANTIVIDDATNFGLAQLYQLRGRVGRSANRAYAYLLYKQEKAMTEEAQARLEAIQEATELGAGFRVAMRDLEIRGAGNLLGAEQSGHIAAVGFDLYSRLLEQAVRQLKSGVDARRDEERAGAPMGEEDGVAEAMVSLSEAARKLVISEKILVSPLVTLDLPLTAYLPAGYIADERVRLAMYQRMVEAQTVEEVKELRKELQDRFGQPPEEALHLLTWLQIKALALQAGVSSVVASPGEFVIRLPILDGPARERLRRRFGRDATVKVGPQFVRLDRRALDAAWTEKLMGVLEVLAA
ncbi:MAG TPA: transcription-repair coupling factor [Chloroflexaceae bacterium]|nr:transcription-repair coupling factor [Chloroflexaceae bacterium]